MKKGRDGGWMKLRGAGRLIVLTASGQTGLTLSRYLGRIYMAFLGFVCCIVLVAVQSKLLAVCCDIVSRLLATQECYNGESSASCSC